MAISDAMRYRMNTGGSAEDLYATIRDFLATSPDAATTQAQMAQYGISGEDVANATGGKSGGLLSGNILAGASWNSSNTALQNQLTEATGQQTSNYAVAGSTTSDTLKQLNTFLAGGGQFDPNSSVYLQAGGVDFITGVDKGVVKDNIKVVSVLGLLIKNGGRQLFQDDIQKQIYYRVKQSSKKRNLQFNPIQSYEN